MLILALDAALARCSAGVFRDGTVLAQRIKDQARGHPAHLAPLVAAVVAEASIEAVALDAIAVTIGPGSFTGLRAALSLAHGLALAIGCPVIGVTTGEAMAEAFPTGSSRHLWVAIDSRRGRVFLDRGAGEGPGGIAAFDLAALPWAGGPVAIAGDAAIAVACALASRDEDVALTDLRLPLPRHIARAAIRRHAGDLPPRDAQPLYLDPPEAKLPAGGLRPAPLA